MASQRYFITGTDTGVGKTYVTGWLAQLGVEAGKQVTVFKPVETGITDLAQSDTRQIQRWLETPANLRVEVGQYFEAPAAPSVANQSGVDISLVKVVEQAKALEKSCDLLLVEGAGGVLVPLTPYTTILDLMRQLNYPVVLVTRPNLGTINHTLLSVREMQQEGLSIAAIVVNEGSSPMPEDERNSLAVQTVIDQLKHWTNLPVVGPLTHNSQSAAFSFINNPLVKSRLISS